MPLFLLYVGDDLLSTLQHCGKFHPWKKIIQKEDGSSSEEESQSGKIVHLSWKKIIQDEDGSTSVEQIQSGNVVYTKCCLEFSKTFQSWPLKVKRHKRQELLLRLGDPGQRI